MPPTTHLRIRLFFTIVLAVAAHTSFGQQQSPTASLAIRANDNRAAAGHLKDGILTLHLELTSGDWYPEAAEGPHMRVDAVAEEGKAPQVPGPMIRVPQGTEINVTFHNLLPATAVVYGMHPHPGDAKDVIEVPAGTIREARFRADVPGTYQYFASAGGEMNRGRPFRDDSQMHGAFIVDPPGGVINDRVFVMGSWRSEATPALSNDVLVINGESWPYTERLNLCGRRTGSLAMDQCQRPESSHAFTWLLFPGGQHGGWRTRPGLFAG